MSDYNFFLIRTFVRISEYNQAYVTHHAAAGAFVVIQQNYYTTNFQLSEGLTLIPQWCLTPFPLQFPDLVAKYPILN